MIEVKGLTKRFGATVAIDDLSFDVAKGEILGFLGPNGAGKSTTIRILTGFLTPSAGTVSIAGADLRKNSLAARKCVGYLPESVPVYREMTVMEYLLFVANMKSVPSRELNSHLDKIISQCGLETVRNKLSSHLSKGYKQRLGLAQALTGDPEVLILDEPTSGLDPKQIIEIRELIRELGTSKTIILSSHVLPEVSQLCKRVIILNEGHLVAVDTPQNLDKNLRVQDIIILGISGHKNPDELVSILETSPDLEKVELYSSPGEEEIKLIIRTSSSIDVRPVIARTVIENNWNLLELKKESQSLEDIFIKLVTQEETVQ